MFAPLPATIDNNGRVATELPIYVGDDVAAASDRLKSVTLRVLLSDPAAENLPAEKRLESALIRPPRTKLGPTSNTPPAKDIVEHLELKINGVLLGKPSVQKGWLVVHLEPQQVAHGDNIVSSRIKQRPSGAEEEIRIDKVEVHVRYRN